MSTSCKEIRRMLEEAGSQRSPEVESHLEGCPGCGAQARLLSILEELPSPAASSSDDVKRLMEDLPLAPWQFRRVATWAPLAVGAGLLGAGVALVGGVPAGSAVAVLPSLSHRLLAWVATGALDVFTVLRSSAEAVRLVVATGGTGVIMWLLLTAVGGGLAVRSLLRQGARSGR